MPIYRRTAVTAKVGINFVRSVVERCGSLFIKIEQESDLGIDAIIEFIKGERPLGRQIATQIRSGESYYNASAKVCVFPIEDHRKYWSDHVLPVYGVVYVPSLRTAHWLDIKCFLAANPRVATVRFQATEVNRFDSDTFAKFILPSVSDEAPLLDIDEALRLARSEEASEAITGLLVLFRRHVNNPKAWDELVHAFRSRSIDEIPPVLIYWLAHIPWHSDISYSGEAIAEPVRTHARELLSRFDVSDVVKLLSFIDPENQICRGALGQSVEAIVSSLPRASSLLRQIISTPEIEIQLREFAVLILGMKEGSGAMPELVTLGREGSWYAGEIAERITACGEVNPYA